jgi:agmatinase
VDYEADQAFTREQLLGTGPAPTFSGATSMFRRRYGRQVAAADVVFVGAPLDLTTTGRSGARHGPRALRAAAAQLTYGAVWPWGQDPFEKLAAIDWGDLAYDPGSVDGFLDAADDFYRQVAPHAVPVTIGGDHFVSYPAVRALAAVHGPLGLLHFDAHSDTWVDARLHHGSMFYHALRHGYLDRRRMVQLGIRSYNPISHGALIIEAPQVRRRSAAEVAAAAADRLGGGPVYITVDVDCLDPSIAPGTGTPVPGGLTVPHVKEIIYELADTALQVVGMDLVEVSPPFDVSEITALAGSSILLDLLCLLARTRNG